MTLPWAAQPRRGEPLIPGAHTPLKQTLLALLTGRALAEHSTPTAAVLQVLTGRVRLVAGHHELDLGEGDSAEIPPVRHHVDSLEDAVVLLTVTQ